MGELVEPALFVHPLLTVRFGLRPLGQPSGPLLPSCRLSKSLFVVQQHLGGIGHFVQRCLELGGAGFELMGVQVVATGRELFVAQCLKTLVGAFVLEPSAFVRGGARRLLARPDPQQAIEPTLHAAPPVTSWDIRLTVSANGVVSWAACRRNASTSDLLCRARSKAGEAPGT